MSGSPAPKPPASKPRSRAPLYAGLAVSALIGAMALAAWVKGGVADAEERSPRRAADGVVCQLLAREGGARPARCAMIVRAPVDEVSATVRDYERFPETFDSSLGSIELSSIERTGDARVHLEGRVTTRLLGDWPIDVRVAHEDGADGSRIASWSETEGSGTFNRGRWVVSPADEGALLAYEIEVQVPWAPTFLVNVVLLTQLAYPLRRVASRVEGAR